MCVCVCVYVCVCVCVCLCVSAACSCRSCHARSEPESDILVRKQWANGCPIRLALGMRHSRLRGVLFHLAARLPQRKVIETVLDQESACRSQLCQNVWIWMAWSFELRIVDYCLLQVPIRVTPVLLVSIKFEVQCRTAQDEELLSGLIPRKSVSKIF